MNNLLQPHSKDLSAGLVSLLANSEVLYESVWAAFVMVFRISEKIAVKFSRNERSAVTEYQSLSYLEKHLPSFPAPKPHGVVRLGKFYLLFTAFIPGHNLEKVWPQLSKIEKRNISSQLETLFLTLRSLLPFPDNTPLGGVEGDGCMDLRTAIRFNSEPIMNSRQFEDFVFAGSKTASPMYTRLLRSLMPNSPAKTVFTHGDLRPANIIVCQEGGDENGPWRIAAVIDWETSGFYPEYWECVKATNILGPRDQFDWYEYLPEVASSRRYPRQWLVDRLWDRNMVNS